MEIMAEQFPGAFSGYDLQVNSLHSYVHWDVAALFDSYAIVILDSYQVLDDPTFDIKK